VTTLKDGLGEIAEQAKLYHVLDRAVEVAARRRAMARIGPVAAAVVMLAGVGLSAGALVDRGQPPAGPAPRVLAWLPAEVPRPDVPAPPLPADQPVGAGAFVYGSYVPGAEPPVLVTEDGDRYRLAERLTEANGVGRQSPALSPDGRWLYQRQGEEVVLRDLTGAAVHRLNPDFWPTAWSTDSRWLLLGGSGTHGNEAIRIEVESGRSVPVHTGPISGSPAVAVLPSGEVVLRQLATVAGVEALYLRVVDPASGAERRRIEVPLAAYLGPGEELAPAALFSPDGTAVVVQTRWVTRRLDGESTIDREGDLLILDIAARTARKIQVPFEPVVHATPQASPSADVAQGGRQSTVASWLPDGILLRTEVGRESVAEVADPVTHEIRVALRLGGSQLVAIRGG
jgi:hypothetical protein